MKIAWSTLSLRTTEKIEFVDITGELKRQLDEMGIVDGLLSLFTRHTTSGVCVNENEAGLLRDIRRFLEELAPPHKDYDHDAKHRPGSENAHSHLQSLCIGPYVGIPVKEGSLLLGTWQSVFFVELDGPRNREVIVQVLGK